MPIPRLMGWSIRDSMNTVPMSLPHSDISVNVREPTHAKVATPAPIRDSTIMWGMSRVRPDFDNVDCSGILYPRFCRMLSCYFKGVFSFDEFRISILNNEFEVNAITLTSRHRDETCERF